MDSAAARVVQGDSPRLNLAEREPLGVLNAVNLALIEGGARYLQLPAGAELNAVLEAGWLLYLLEGRLVLRNRDGERFATIEAGASAALSPVFAEGASDISCLMLEPARLMRIDRLHYQVMLGRQLDESTVVTELGADERDAEVFGLLYDAFAADALTVPSLPEVAMAVNRAAQDPDMTFQRLAAIIQRDPPYTARLIQIANSPSYRGAVKVDTLSAAIGRIGVGSARNLVMSMAVGDSVDKVHPKAVAALRRFYDEAIEVAALCCALCVQSAAKLPRERALLAGLLHRLGMVPIINYASALGGQLPSAEELMRIAERLNEPVSAWLLGEWGLDDTLVDAAEFGSAWYRPVEGEDDLIALLIAARLLRYSALEHEPPVALAKTPVGEWLRAAQLPVDDVQELLAVLAEDVEAARQLLR